MPQTARGVLAKYLARLTFNIKNLSHDNFTPQNSLNVGRHSAHQEIK